MSETYYERLGVAPDATAEEIRRAYRHCLKEAHPDVSDDPDAADRTMALMEAKEVLTDGAERERYDRLGHDRYVGARGGVVDPDGDDVADSGPPGGAPTGRGTATGATRGHASGDASRGDPRSDGSRGSARGSGGEGGAGSERAQRRRQNRETRASWNATGSGEGGGRGSAAYAGRWRAWDTDAPYRVHATDRGSIGSRLFPPGPSLLLLAVGFAIYPVMLWAALEPAFPFPVNLVVGACLLGLVAFLVGMPVVGIVVFGVWSVLLPTVLTVGFGVAPLTPIWLVAVAGTALPLGLAVLVFVALRA